MSTAVWIKCRVAGRDVRCLLFAPLENAIALLDPFQRAS